MATLTGMQEPEGTPDLSDDEPRVDPQPRADAAVSADDAELVALESDLDTVDAALAALDADDLDRAEELAPSLVEDTASVADETAVDAPPASD